MVTGKNKEQFEKWYFEHFKCMNPLVQSVNQFYQLERFELQLGVYLAYYDSIGYVIDIMYLFAFKQYTFELENKGGDLNLPYKENLFNSRNKAYKEAFKQADKLINK